MDTDDIAPPPKRPQLVPLEAMSIEELRSYIAALEADIAAAQAMITKKQEGRGAADALFKRPS